MSYDKSWNTDAQNASDALYIFKRDFVQVLRELESKNWSLVEHRQQAFDVWHGMPTKFIVSHDKQFPQWGYYVSMEMCDFPKVAAQLEMAIAYKESSKHRNEPIGPPEGNKPKNGFLQIKSETGHTEGMIVSFSSDDDARKAYYEAIRTFKVLAATVSCGFDRQSFEDRFGLKWAP